MSREYEAHARRLKGSEGGRLSMSPTYEDAQTMLVRSPVEHDFMNLLAALPEIVEDLSQQRQAVVRLAEVVALQQAHLVSLAARLEDVMDARVSAPIQDKLQQTLDRVIETGSTLQEYSAEVQVQGSIRTEREAASAHASSRHDTQRRREAVELGLTGVLSIFGAHFGAGDDFERLSAAVSHMKSYSRTAMQEERSLTVTFRVAGLVGGEPHGAS